MPKRTLCRIPGILNFSPDSVTRVLYDLEKILFFLWDVWMYQEQQLWNLDSALLPVHYLAFDKSNDLFQTQISHLQIGNDNTWLYYFTQCFAVEKE